MAASDVVADAAPDAGAVPSPALLAHPSLDPTQQLIYCCRRCRAPLFRPEHVTAHEAGQHGFTRHRMVKDAHGGSGGGGAAVDRCTSFFLAEALQWMEGASHDVEGKLHCPKCAARVGSLAWAGSQCSCGTWVTPAIQMTKKAVDERYFPREAGAGAGMVAGAGAGGPAAAAAAAQAEASR